MNGKTLQIVGTCSMCDINWKTDADFLGLLNQLEGSAGDRKEVKEFVIYEIYDVLLSGFRDLSHRDPCVCCSCLFFR